MNDNICIGMINDYDETRLTTFSELKKYAEAYSYYSIEQYLDWRFNANLSRFVFDPFTGKKIDWVELRKSI